jgi:hypothetical protein
VHVLARVISSVASGKIRFNFINHWMMASSPPSR